MLKKIIVFDLILVFLVLLTFLIVTAVKGEEIYHGTNAKEAPQKRIGILHR